MNAQNPSRRLILAATSAAGVCGALSLASAGEAQPEIILLMRELEQTHIERLSFDPLDPAYDEVADNANYQRHWLLRERIDDLPARAIEDLKAKARAAELALERDPDAECRGAGSFVGLSQSTIRDLIALSA